jgi:signal transduction histidine kinase
MSDTVPAETGAPAVGGDGRRLTLAEQELVGSLGWLVAMRWVAGVGVLLSAFVAERILGLPVPGVWLGVVGIFILVYNAGLRWWLGRFGTAMPDPSLSSVRFVRIQIGLDWLAMTVLTSLSGGIESPVIIFFLFHISIAALLLPHAKAYLEVALAPALVALVTVFEYEGILPHVSLYRDRRYQDPIFIASVLSFFTAACYMLAYFCMRIAVRLRRREKEIGGLYESVRDATASLDLQTVLNRLVESATRVLGCKGAAIRLLDPERKQVAFAATYGLSDTYVERVPQEFTRSRLDQATLAGEPLFVDDATADPRVWNRNRVREEGIESMLSVPLAGKSGPLGVLRAYGGEGHRFSDEDAAFLELVAAHGVVAIENAQAYLMLEEMDREKSRFVRTATHELRSPINVTESLLTALATGYVGELSPEHVEVVNRALKRVQALKSLVNDLLDLAAGKALAQPTERRRVPIGALVTEVCERFQTRAAAKGIDMSVPPPAEPVEVLADPADIDRIVTNLVSNAVKYTVAGRVTVSVGQEGGFARLVVADTGIGIPAESIPKLFQEFYRARNAKALEEAGTGLGLTIVRDLVERYGGRVSVESREGEGTTFTVLLPLAARPAAAGLKAEG